MASQKNQRVEVLRAFRKGGEIIGVGSVIDLPVGTAAELAGANKVKFVQADKQLKTTDTPTPRMPVNPAKGGDEAKESPKGKKA